MSKMLKLIVLCSIFYGCEDTKEKMKTETNNQQDSLYIVSDSIKLVRSDEIKAALEKGTSVFSPIDYAFMKEELSELKESDTLFFSSNDYDSNSMLGNYAFLSSDLKSDSLSNSFSKYVYVAPTDFSKLTLEDYIDASIGAEMIGALYPDSIATLAINSSNKLFEDENNKLTVKGLPQEYEVYNLAVLQQNLKINAFSEIVGEEQIMNYLIQDLESTLNLIQENPVLQERFDSWITQLGTPSGWLYYSDDYPAELHARKLDYLISELKSLDHPLSKITWKALDNVQIVKLEELD